MNNGKTAGKEERKGKTESDKENWGDSEMIDKFIGREGHDVSLKEVPAVSVCPLFGPSRALIVNHLGAKPKSHWTLK